MKHEQLRNHVEGKKDDLVKEVNAVLERFGISGGEMRALTFAAAGGGDCPPGKTPVVVITVDPNTGNIIRRIECR